MRYLIFGIVLLIIQTNLQAQQLSFRGGLGISNNQLFEDNEQVFNEYYNWKMGPVGGFVFSSDLNEKFKFQTGLLIANKGSRFEISDSFEEIEINDRTNMDMGYAILPFQVLYPIDAGQISISLQAGMYLGIGMFGKITSKGNFANEFYDEEEKITWGTEVGNLKRLDFGPSLGIGITFSKITFLTTYEFGMRNIGNFSSDELEIKNRSLNFTIQFPLNGF